MYKSTFIRVDPSMLVIDLQKEESDYRAGAQLLKDKKKFLEEKINCTACNKHIKNALTKGAVAFHSSFEVIICKDCEKFYASGEFSVDEDGSDKYCRWCGQGGSLYCCSTCSVAICEKCVKINFARKYRREIEADDWVCFICDPKPIWPHRAIAAAVREYLDMNKLIVKHKRRYSDDSEDNSPSQVKRARKDSSRESKIAIDSSDDSGSESPVEKSKGKKKDSSSNKSSKKGVVDISDDDVDDDVVVTNGSKKEKSKKKQNSKKNYVSDPEEEDESENENKKSRRSSRKSQADRKETKDSVKVDSKKSTSTSRRSKKIITDDDDDLESDKSVFRDASSSKTSSRKSPAKSKSSTASRRRVSSESCELVDRDAVRMFQHLLKDSLKDIEKLLKITGDSKNSFRDKYVTEKKHLRNFHDVGVAKEKYLAFLGNLVNSTKRIEDTFASSIEPLISSADSKKALAKTASSPSPTRESADTSQLSNGVANKSSVEDTEKSDAEDEVAKKSSEMDVDEIASESQNTSADLMDVEKPSSPVSVRKATTARKSTAGRKSTTARKSTAGRHSILSAPKDTDDEKDASEEKADSKENGKSSPDVSMTNGVDESTRRDSYNYETTISENGVSDSMIVNLGTEDESVFSEVDCKVESSKKSINGDVPEITDDEKSGESPSEKKSSSKKKSVNGDLPEVTDDEKSIESSREKSKKKSVDADLLEISDDETSKSGESPREKKSKKKSVNGDVPEISDDETSKSSESAREKSSIGENNCDGSDVGDAVDGDSCAENDKSKEELAKSDLLRNSESSTENETDDCASKKAVKKHSRENDETLSSKLPSPGVSSDSKEEKAESQILNESDEDDGKNDEIKSQDEDIGKSNEKSAKKELLLSSDSSANDSCSKSGCDSEMSGVDVLQKNSDNKKSV